MKNSKKENMFKSRVYLDKNVDIQLNTLFEMIINIDKKHLNAFFNNNYNNILLDSCNFRKVLFINYIIQKEKTIIKIYKHIGTEKIECIIKKIDDLNYYSFISFYIKKEGQIMHNVFSIFDFKNMLYDMKMLIFLKLLLEKNNININDFYPNYKKAPLEIFYEQYLYKNNTKNFLIINLFKKYLLKK